MKKIISLLITLAMLIACLPVTVMAETTVSFTGEGTSSDPYKIANAEQLKEMRDFVNSGDGKNDAGKYFVLTADIDLGGQEWTPIGFTESSNQYAFTGTFDGDGHVIKNFKITDIPEGTTVSYTNVGLFGAVQGGTIKNLGVEDVSITVDNKPDKSAINRVGALVGRLAGTVTNCYAKNITCRKLDNCAGTNMSGFIGVLRGKSTITDCYVNGFDVDTAYTNIITAHAFVDAAEGKNNESVITNCYVVNAIKNGVTNFYAFAVEGKGGDKAPTLNNCWSTAVDGSGAVASHSRGNLGATKAGVVAAMTESAGSTYTVDKNKNAGYPCLSFEKKALVPATDFAGGNGTSSDPYKIATAEQLMYMRNLVNSGDGKNDAGKYFVLTADIDLGGQEWTPIGFTESSNQYAFTGTFDGDGHVIKNFKITDIPEGTTVSYTNVGLFGAVQGGTIKNLGVEDVSITVDNKPDKSAINRVGALVGRLAGTVTNCYAKNITCRKLDNCAGTNMSGFIGVLRGKSTITDCYVNGFDVDTAYTNIITAHAFVDAAEGKNNESVITNCYVVNAIKNGVTNFYAFAVEGKGGDKAPTLNNCWSTADDGSGAVALHSRGNLGATKDLIREAFKDVSGYQINDAINDGFPSLSFETVEEGSDYVVAAVVPGDKVYVKLIANNNVSGAQVYVATYDSNGRLLDVDVAEVVSPYEFTTNVSTSGAYTVKVFVWNGDQSPLADAYEGKFINGKLVNTDELSYSISNGVMTIEYANDIADYASFKDTPWSGETTVTKIVLGSNVTGIGANAFSGFTNLESIEIPEAVETIADNALPNTDFTIYGYANGAAEEYADAKNKTFQLKKLRILTIGNSHTLDHGEWNKEIWGDIADAGIETEIVYDRVTNGGFKMYYEDSFDTKGYPKSHYAQAHNPSSPNYSKYADKLKNYKWDVVLIQDYRESASAEEDFTDAMAKTVQWLKEEQPDAKIGWIVDWNDKNYGIDDKARLQQLYYDNTVTTVNKVKAMTADKPDFIIPMGTAMQNVRTSYLWDVKNAPDCYTNYDNKDWCGSAEEIVTYNLLERDGTHCSYELGRYIMGAAVFGYIYSKYQDKLIGGDVVDFCKALKTMPVTTGAEEWKGEFTDSIWDIVKETTKNTIANPWEITNSVYTVDPAIAKAVEVENATYADFTPAGIVATIKKLGNGFTVSESDIEFDGNTATVTFLYGYSEKTVTISKK